MFTVVCQPEMLDCVALRADTQSFEPVGLFPTLEDCYKATTTGDGNILLVASRKGASELTCYLDGITEVEADGSRTYFWMDYHSKVIRVLDKFRNYPDAVQEARRRLITDKVGIVFDENKRKLWSLQVCPACETVH